METWTYENTHMWALTLVGQAVKILRVIDGDTLWIGFLTELGQPARIKVRLAFIDCYELKGPSHEKAMEAKKYLESISPYVIATSHGYDKYGRLLASLVTKDDGRDINTEMVQRGWATNWEK